jgi:hypothetical protein
MHEATPKATQNPRTGEAKNEQAGRRNEKRSWRHLPRAQLRATAERGSAQGEQRSRLAHRPLSRTPFHRGAHIRLRAPEPAQRSFPMQQRISQ